jgi:hypothetical protein
VKKVRNTAENRKVLGEYGELCFAAKAASEGLAILKSHGDSLPYDVAVDNGAQLLRVQVKAVGTLASGYYIANCVRRNARPYRSDEIDFLAVYLVPEDLWYVIPVRALKGRRSLYLHPNRACAYEQYCEAWHLLAPDNLIRRIFAQADDGTLEFANFPPLTIGQSCSGSQNALG